MQAPIYIRQTSFADDERNNVGGRSSVLTAEVDAELDRLGGSTNQTTANLKLLQRDDGVMRDGVVPVSALSAEVLKLLTTGTANVRGAWATATAYAYKDLVTQGGNTYIAVIAHTSGVFATDLAAVKWILFQVGSPRGRINANKFGAKFDGTTDDTSAINAAIIFMNGMGGGTVDLDPGTAIVSAPGIDHCIRILSNVTLQGAGKNITFLKLADHQDDMVVDVFGATNVGLRDLTIDGNRANQTAGVHGFRSGGVDGLLIQNVMIKETNSYGMGLEEGTQKNVRIIDVDILNTSDDGIDFKNPNNDNDLIIIDRVNITNPGLGAFTGQTGIDVRGPARLSNIHVRGVKAQNVGIRFRNTGIAGAGIGGHKSSLTNFSVYCDNDTNNMGVSVPAFGVQIANGYVNGAAYGVNILGANCEVANVQTDECDIGFYAGSGVDDFGVTLRASYATFVNCHARRTAVAGGTFAFYVGAGGPGAGGLIGVDVGSGCVGQNINTGAFLDASATAFVHDCDFSSCTNGINDGGLPNTLSRYRNVKGFANENSVFSAALDITTVGRKTFVQPHSLNLTPDPKDVTFTVVQGTGVTDARYGAPVLEGTNASQVAGSLYVTTASATPGATAFVLITVASRTH